MYYNNFLSYFKQNNNNASQLITDLLRKVIQGKNI